MYSFLYNWDTKDKYTYIYNLMYSYIYSIYVSIYQSSIYLNKTILKLISQGEHDVLLREQRVLH